MVDRMCKRPIEYSVDLVTVVVQVSEVVLVHPIAPHAGQQPGVAIDRDDVPLGQGGASIA